MNTKRILGAALTAGSLVAGCARERNYSLKDVNEMLDGRGLKNFAFSYDKTKTLARYNSEGKALYVQVLDDRGLVFLAARSVGPGFGDDASDWFSKVHEKPESGSFISASNKRLYESIINVMGKRVAASDIGVLSEYTPSRISFHMDGKGIDEIYFSMHDMDIHAERKKGQILLIEGMKNNGYTLGVNDPRLKNRFAFMDHDFNMTMSGDGYGDDDINEYMDMEKALERVSKGERSETQRGGQIPTEKRELAARIIDGLGLSLEALK